jgi:CDP-diacylglycerol---glycerol-3-phosphate 3-phosphatidyltransferase
MNIANKITISRILIMPAFIIGILDNSLGWRFVSLACFMYASFSDWLDGYLARKNNLVSDFGKFMDPLADKIFISSAFICFTSLHDLNIPAWMVIIIISREFIITGFRTLAVSKGVVIPAKSSGKFKTTSQLITIFVILVLLIIDSYEKYSGVHVLGYSMKVYTVTFPLITMSIVTALTLFSGISYIVENRNLLKG